MKKIVVLLAEGFEEIEAVTPVDILRRAGVEVLLTGVSDKKVKGSNGIVIETDCLLKELPIDIDGVVIPGGMPGSRNISDSEEAGSLIRKCYESGRLIAAICAAPAVVLGEMGLLEGLKFTGYPGTEKSVNDAKHSEERVVIDRNLITSRGPGTAAEFSLALVEYLVDSNKAEEIRKGTLQPV